MMTTLNINVYFSLTGYSEIVVFKLVELKKLFTRAAQHSVSVNSRGLRVFVLSFVRPPTRETTVFNISFMRLFVAEAS